MRPMFERVGSRLVLFMVLGCSLSIGLAQERPVIPWQRSMAEAKAAAAQDGKPILLLQLLGNLDEELC